MEKAHIGLFRPMVCLDYGSATNRYDGANLRPIDIQKCKESWTRMGWGRDWPNEGRKNNNEEKERKCDYIVEFLPDEDSDKESRVVVHKDKES
ncbi:Flp pilus assembly protein TadG [Sesbania bispinosa]|nr:Flp pilus assembly protein TadG [Sesbania bispinosa]